MNAAPADSSFIVGVQRFNQHEFWEAHESWESIWLRKTGEEKLFLQGLIQLAAAYHHVKRGTYRGAVRLFDAAFAKLGSFPEGYGGVERAHAIDVAREHRTRIASGQQIDAAEYAKLTLVGG
jgi:predicted metal-dependent hydrolase